MIVICSPKTPQSQWVKRRLRPLHPFTVMKKYGILSRTSSVYEEKDIPIDGSFVEVIVEVEPLAADIRAGHLGGMKKRLKVEILCLLAPILNCGFDDLIQRHRDRMVRRIVTLSLSLSFFFLCFGSFSSYRLISSKRNLCCWSSRFRRPLQAILFIYRMYPPAYWLKVIGARVSHSSYIAVSQD